MGTVCVDLLERPAAIDRLDGDPDRDLGTARHGACVTPVEKTVPTVGVASQGRCLASAVNDVGYPEKPEDISACQFISFASTRTKKSFFEERMSIGRS